MGIPKFARWISAKYPRCVTRSPPKPSAGLLIDMNGIIHPCCHDDGKVIAGGEEGMIRRVIEKVEALIHLVGPTEMVFLALDGVAPRAKMKQQRIRRYMSALGRYGGEEVIDPGTPLRHNIFENDDSGVEGTAKDAANDSGEEPTERDQKTQRELFDDDGLMEQDEDDMNDLKASLDLGVLSLPQNILCVPAPMMNRTFSASTGDSGEGESAAFDDNCISPGTSFMVSVAKALKAQAVESWASKYPGVSFVVSDTQIPGEGEHKLIDYLREYGQPAKPYVIHGNDADLILLTLLLHNRNVVIMKEQKFGNRTSTDYFSVDEIRRGLARDLSRRIQKLNPGLAKAVPSLGQIGLVEDFVLLSTLVGNDFLPHVPSAFIAEHTMDNFMELYAHAFMKMRGFLSQVDGIHAGRLAIFLELYARVEASFFRFRMMTIRVLTEADLAGPLDSTSDERWRSVYYRTTLRLQSPGEKEIMDVARKYLEGVAWVWGYYTTVGSTDWTWEYPHSHAPLAYDLVRYLRSLGDDTTILFPSSLQPPLPPLLQLLCILPPTSRALLPKSMGHLMKRKDLAECFPSRWRVDYTGADKEYMSTIMFPNLDTTVVLAAAAPMLSQLTPEEADRNRNTTETVVLNGLREGLFPPRDCETEKERKETRKIVQGRLKAFMTRARWGWLARQAPMCDVVPVATACAALGVSLRRCSISAVVLSAYVVYAVWGLTAGWKRKLLRPVFESRKPKEVYRDWLCVKCNVRNFEKNVVCFTCQEPWSDTTCPVVMSLMHAATQHFDVDHEPNIRDMYLAKR